MHSLLVKHCIAENAAKKTAKEIKTNLLRLRKSATYKNKRENKTLRIIFKLHCWLKCCNSLN